MVIIIIVHTTQSNTNKPTNKNITYQQQGGHSQEKSKLRTGQPNCDSVSSRLVYSLGL
jgi:hypothetical protein